MERQGFYFLYVNLNSLGELALKQLAAEALAQPLEVGTPESLSQDELDARVLAGFENVDLSALEGLDLSGAAPELPGFEASASEEMKEIAGSGDAFDLERYLARAYSYEEQLRPRIDAYYRQADLSAIETSLSQLPRHLRALTSPLTAADMGEWLALYKQGNDELTGLVLTVRQLDLSA